MAFRNNENVRTKFVKHSSSSFGFCVVNNKTFALVVHLGMQSGEASGYLGTNKALVILADLRATLVTSTTSKLVLT
jgi:hypothetical protein